MDLTAVDAVPESVELTDVAPSDSTSGDDGRSGSATASEPLKALSPGWRAVVVVGGAAAVATGVVLRFVVHSPMWLDEALTVDIARLPLRDLHAALRRDGAPPLFYVLLHFWMRAFGDSDLGARSLSGVLSVATLPLVWVAGRRYGGRTVAWVALLLLATAPFAIYYATEARMYALVMFLTACGFVALQRALDRPAPGNVIALAVVTAALLYSQYWALYLTAMVVAWLAFRVVRSSRRPVSQEDGADRADRGGPASGPRWALGAVALGCLAFVPWLPTFLFQSAHTGTPWAQPPTFAAVINAITGFTDNQATNSVAGSNQARLLALCYFAVGALALFGVARDRWHIVLDLRTRPAARPLAFVVMGTLLLAISGAIFTGSAFSNRYAAVVFVPLILLIALGSLTLADVRIRTAVVLVAVVAGLAAGAENVGTQRTQAEKVAQALVAAHAQPGDVVVFCPDQLGPSVLRLVPKLADGQPIYDMVTYPRGTGPAFVNWVDYLSAIDRSNPQTFADRVLATAERGHHQIWVVWSDEYQGFGDRCNQLVSDLQNTPTPAAHGARNWVSYNSQEYYEAMTLTQVNPYATGS